jgi:hypothetical protein
MKGFITKTLAGVALTGGFTSGGCYHYQKVVDPCWPERYEYKARQEVISAFAPQVQNGHILDQTVYNNQFEPGTDRLTDSGRDQLDVLVRRRPGPDPRIFLATARDIAFDPNNPEGLVEVRRDLDNRRAIAIQKYVGAQTAGRPMQYEIVVHDPMPVTEHADSANRSSQLNHNSTIGSFIGGSSATTASSTGGSGTGGGGAGTVAVSGPGGQGQGQGQGGQQPTQTPR